MVSTVAIVSGHAPPSVSPPHILQQWWDELAAAVGKIPRRFCLIACLDANARFHQQADEPATLSSTTICRNSRHLVDFAHRVNGDVSDQFDCRGTRLTSWTSPGGHQSLLDYVVYPRTWRPGAVTLPTPDLQDLHSGRDHDPVALELNVTCQSTRPQDSLHVDVAALSTAQGQAVARGGPLSPVPVIPWSVDSTRHVDLVHRHLHAQLRRFAACPSEGSEPGPHLCNH